MASFEASEITVLQQVKFTASICLGLAFMVMSVQLVSRCYAHRVPALRLMKGRRINTLCAADNWKISVDAGDGDGGSQTTAARPAALPERPTLFRRASAILSLGTLIPVRTPEVRSPVLSSGPFSAAAIPLRC